MTTRSGGGAPAKTGRPLRERPVRPAAVGVRQGWREAIATTVGGLGFELVEVERAQRGLLRITIDRVPGRGYPIPGEFITVDDCEQVTRQLQYALEVEGLEYARLEVSSPGLDRPLKTEADFQRFAGQAVSITLKVPFQGRKAWQGVLVAAADAPAVEPPAAQAMPAETAAPTWSLVFKQGKTEQVLGFRFDEVREARLVPVVDFKGRKARPQAGDAETAGDPQADENLDQAVDPAVDQEGQAPRAAAGPGEEGG